MSGELTRRSFVSKSAGAAAGVTALGTLIAVPAEAQTGRHHRAAHGAEPIGSDPVVAFVRDPRRGEVSVMAGERRVTIRDRKLAAQISRAARGR
jgi:hypothetical protein